MSLVESEPPKHRRQIHSWKSIAEYLHRDVRTVQRWEKTAGLPVRRLQHDTRATVFAWSDELDAWLEGRSEGGAAHEPIAPRKSKAMAVYAALAAAVVTMVLVGWSRLRTDEDAGPPPTTEARPVTFEPGLNWAARLSPDGRRVAYCRQLNPDAPSDIVIRDLASGSEIVVNATPLHEYSPAWAPSGAEIAFFRCANHGAISELIIASLDDFEERTVARFHAIPFPQATIVGPAQLDWSPDGRYLLTSESESLAEPYRLVLIDVATGRRRNLTEPGALGGEFSGDVWPRWSPDGQRICWVRRFGAVGRRIAFAEFERPGPLTPRLLDLDADELLNVDVTNPSWAPDGASILFGASPHGTPRARLWRIAVDRPGAKPTPVGALGALGADLRETPDGRWTLVHGANGSHMDIVQIPLSRETSVPKPAPQGSWRTVAQSLAHDNRPAVSPDGERVAFTSRRSGSNQIWVVDLRSGEARQATKLDDTARIGDKLWSPDGENIVFILFGPDGRDVASVRVSDGYTRRLVAAEANEWPVGYSAGGELLYFLRGQGGDKTLWSINAGGGAREASETLRTAGARVNPRGGMIVFSDGQFHALRDLDTEPAPLFKQTVWDPTSYVVAESGIYFVSAGNWLGYYGFDDGVVRTLVRFTEPLSGGLAVSPSEDSVFVTVARLQTQIMAIDDVRGLFR